MAKEMANKSVSFNLLDPHQVKMKEYAEQFPNFSGYIKRLIQRDMEGESAVKTTKKAPAHSHVIHGGTNAFTGFVLGQK